MEKSKTEIELGLNSCIDKITEKYGNVIQQDFTEWKRKVIIEVENKMKYLKQKIKAYRTNPILKQEGVLKYLECLHQKYVLVPIDKASNNIAIICKKFYVQVILREIGVLGPGNMTYETVSQNAEKIIDINLEYNSRLKLPKMKKTRACL